MIEFYRGEGTKFNTEDHKNGIFFTTDSNEILTGNKQSYGKNADTSVITEDILVEGGPLADYVKDKLPDNWIDSNNNKIIPKGESIQTIFSKLLSKIINGTVSWNNPIWNPELKNPTINLSETKYEIGTSVTVNFITYFDILNSDRTCSLKATEGYFKENDNTWYEKGNSVYQQLKTSNVTDDSKLITTVTYGDKVIPNNGGSSTITVEEGDKTFKVTTSGITVTVDPFDYIKVYASTNTKQKLNNFAELNDTKPSDISLSKDTTKTITGAYKYFIGSYSDYTFDKKEYTSDNIRSTEISGFVNGKTINKEISVPIGTKGMYIAIPKGIDDSGETLTVKQISTNNYVNSEMITNKKTLSNMTCGGIHTKDYIIFTWSFSGGTTGEEKFLITQF